MTAAIQTIGPLLRRAVVLKQVDERRWSVVGYERHGGRWRSAWLLHRAAAYRQARETALELAREMGLPVSELAIDGRFQPVRTNGRGVA